MASEHTPDNSALKLLVQRMPMPSGRRSELTVW